MPTGNTVDAIQNPAEQVNPPVVPVPVHGDEIVGVIQVEPLQYKVPDTLPAPVHAPPNTAVASTAAPAPELTQTPAEQVKPATVDVPVHAMPTAGVFQVAPLQYSDPDTLPAVVHAPPATALPPPLVQNPAVQVKPATVEVPVHAVPTAGVIQVAPLQYSDPDMLPAPAQAPPTTAVPPTAVQMPDAQVKAPTVDAPVHAVPTAGVIQVAPLQ